MFNEDTIKQNQVCYLEGKAQALSDLLFKMEIKGRHTIKDYELRELVKYECIEYEKAWNKWADGAKIGGGRYDETGNQRKAEYEKAN